LGTKPSSANRMASGSMAKLGGGRLGLGGMREGGALRNSGNPF
jgi:hypothetical protein